MFKIRGPLLCNTKSNDNKSFANFYHIFFMNTCRKKERGNGFSVLWHCHSIRKSVCRKSSAPCRAITTGPSRTEVATGVLYLKLWAEMKRIVSELGGHREPDGGAWSKIVLTSLSAIVKKWFLSLCPSMVKRRKLAWHKRFGFRSYKLALNLATWRCSYFHKCQQENKV